ncbi:hypothetical protein [Flavobacterium sp. HJJ]|uniref:hypothetical protein n=1 Tax=Flavobacterium sp. HJJ TaxID=2783792 RepID=UPI00188C80FD|nr:hypothetical protein [Flavobacterium sp. HJJ]MBF4473310.1 hypothetical protein [Flavobacterium sp. HJJ]
MRITEKFILLICIIFSTYSNSQSKMIVGNKHTILVEIPKKWIQAQNDQLPFFIKPDEKNVSELTYMYVYGIDYDTNPKLDEWIDGNNKYLIENEKGVKIGSLDLKFENIKKDNYVNGNYKIVTYEYKNKRKECLLIIECINTIVTVVLSTDNDLEFKKYIKSFEEIVKSTKILGTTLKVQE